VTANQPNPIEQIKNTLAAVLGEDPDRITQIQPQWLRFMKQGVVVDLHVGRWRGRSKLEYADLGLPEPRGDAGADALANLLTLGRKNLLPTRFLKKFDAIEASARKLVNENGASTYWGVFVTAERYQDKVKAGLDGYYSEYFRILTEMTADFEAVKSELADEYRHQARLAYTRLTKIAPDLLDQGETDFVETFVANILTLIPPVSEIEASFNFAWELRFIPLPDLLAQENQQASMFDIETQRQYEQAEHDRRMNRIVEGAEADRQRKLAQAETQIRLEVLNRAKLEKDQQVTSFMKDLVTQLRGLVYEASTDILGTLQKNDRLHPRSVVQIRNLVEAVGQMNFFGDSDLDAMIARVQAQMATIQTTDNKDVGAIRETLEAVATLTRETLINLGETPRSGRSVGIAEVPSLDETRQARQVLELPDIQPMEAARHGRQEVES